MRKYDWTQMVARSRERPQTMNQLMRYHKVLAEHPEAIVCEVCDEYTGERFGKARKRIGQCLKLGGARQPRFYQAWATWAEADIN